MANAMPFLCLACTRYDGERDTCDAFPQGIPTPILDGASHWEPMPGDGGLHFDPDPEAGDALRGYIAYWYALEGTDQLDV